MYMYMYMHSIYNVFDVIIIFSIVLHETAVVEAGSLTEIYDKVKNVIHEQSGNYIWVPATDSL